VSTKHPPSWSKTLTSTIAVDAFRLTNTVSVAVAVLAGALVWATLRPGRGEGADAPADEPALDGEIDLPIPEPVPSAP
jgi:hypothetical protein